MESFENFTPPSQESLKHFEGNESLVLVSRFRNSDIRSQVIGTMRRAYQLLEETGGGNGQFQKDENGMVKMDEKGNPIELPFASPSDEEIGAEYDKNVDEIERITNITFTGEEPHQNTMDLHWEFPGIGKMSDKQKSIIEAHEKGHWVRRYPGEIERAFFEQQFSTSFDQNAVDLNISGYKEKFKELNELSDEKIAELLLAKIFSPSELAERMSQMKNYFGLNGDEQFTAEHLSYVRENYVRDTGIDNLMTETFNAITPEVEPQFLKLINGLGI